LQSKAQFHLQSLGENETVIVVKTYNLFPQMKTPYIQFVFHRWFVFHRQNIQFVFHKSPHCGTVHFHTLKCSTMQSNANLLPISCHFNVMQLLVMIMVP